MSETRVAMRTSNPAKTVDHAMIVGWGVDANPQNDPTYPYRDRSEDDHSGEWQRPTQQEPDIELLKSVEHKWLPAVFGTASPPSGLSGSMRRLAFRWSESNWAHWLLLIGADRVNMIEGVIEDLAHSQIPNIPKEMGVPAEWRHNKTGLIKKVGVTAAIVGTVTALFLAQKKAREPEMRNALNP
ncbi:hypothetical protein [Sphingomonas arenae]|uniref:hypothetical protein n=1 Tax=Sphingomonas arenae TaxID=2812555 RepID=UPI0019675DF4|nr:hypothetical protein [Sphingomonas arenae]